MTTLRKSHPNLWFTPLALVFLLLLLTTFSAQAQHTLFGWGNNAFGQLGDNTTTSRLLPPEVGGLSNVVALAAGNYHAVAVKADGTVWTWGMNDEGQLGDGTRTNRLVPVQVQGLENVIAVARVVITPLPSKQMEPSGGGEAILTGS